MVIAREIVATGKYRLEVKKRKLPRLKNGEVLIRTKSALISPGTELCGLSGAYGFPWYPGYSNSGVIEETGKGVGAFKKGDRVISFAPHASHAIQKVEDINLIPAGVSFEDATFTVLGSTALHGVRDANMAIGESVGITGQGLVGQLILRLVKLTGAKTVVAIDLYRKRLKLAIEGGADYAFSPKEKGFEEKIKEITGGKGLGVIFESSGNPQSIPMAFNLAGIRGKIIVVSSYFGKKVELDLFTVFQNKIISLIASWQPRCPDIETPYYTWNKKNNRDFILKLMSEGKLKVHNFITHRFPYQKVSAAYESHINSREDTLGVILNKW